jgi:hypothetical protein
MRRRMYSINNKAMDNVHCDRYKHLLMIITVTVIHSGKVSLYANQNRHFLVLMAISISASISVTHR